MTQVMRCPNCEEFVGSKDQFLHRPSTDKEEPEILYWFCDNCGHSWPV